MDVMALAQIVVGKSSIDDYELVDYDENHMLDLLDVMYLVQKVADKKNRLKTINASFVRCNFTILQTRRFSL